MRQKLSLAGSALAFAAALALAGPALAKPRVAAATAPMPVLQAATAAQARDLTGAERAQALAQASRALDQIARLQGGFAQINPDGTRSTGRVWLQRPGRLRMEYDAPSPLLLVADGTTAAIEDRALKTVERVPLRSTPLHFILKRDINLDRDARVVRVARESGFTLITLRDRTGETDGQITLAFDGSNALKRWTIVDGGGQVTELALRETTTPASIDPRLFRIQDAQDPTARRRDR